MAPGPHTSKAHPQHKTYPYLLRGVPIVAPNQVWSTDITYIRLARGFVYLVVYASASGGGALIVDKYPRAEEKPGQRRAAARETECNLN